MMITLIATGTRGDTQPYLALAVELKKRGKDVRVVAAEENREFVESYGVDFYAIKMNTQEVLKDPEVVKQMTAKNPLQFFTSFKKFSHLMAPLQHDIWNGCKDSELIIYHPGAAIAYYIGRKLNIPTLLAAPFPMTKTKEYPSLLFYGKTKGGNGFINKFSYNILQMALWSASKDAIKIFWQEEFGTDIKLKSPYAFQQSAELPTIVSCSQYLFPKPNDVSEHVHITGNWFLEDNPNYLPSAELVEFINNGEKPIYIGFGSVSDPEMAEKISQSVFEAIALSGERAVIATGWNGIKVPEHIPTNAFIIESIPHSWLFPQMKVIVHHGGAGTTAEAVRAGVPSVIVPFGNDQPGWASRIADLHLGSKPLPMEQLTGTLLAERINEVRDGSIIENARETGSKVRSEHGTQKAVDIILSTLAV